MYHRASSDIHYRLCVGGFVDHVILDFLPKNLVYFNWNRKFEVSLKLLCPMDMYCLGKSCDVSNGSFMSVLIGHLERMLPF